MERVAAGAKRKYSAGDLRIIAAGAGEPVRVWPADAAGECDRAVGIEQILIEDWAHERIGVVVERDLVGTRQIERGGVGSPWHAARPASRIGKVAAHARRPRLVRSTNGARNRQHD